MTSSWRNAVDLIKSVFNEGDVQCMLGGSHNYAKLIGHVSALCGWLASVSMLVIF